MQIELTEDERQVLTNMIRLEFDTKIKAPKDFLYRVDNELWNLMTKLDSEAAREMYHDIELEYGRPPQIETK